MQEEVASIAGQRASLLGALGTLGAGAWNTPTACTPWNVQDVVAHLVDIELLLGRIYRGELREVVGSEPAAGIERWRALPGPAVAAAFWQHGTATQRVMEAMSEETRGAPVRAFGCSQVREVIRLHLFELAVHGHDVTDAVGAPAIWDECAPFLNELGVSTEGERSLRCALAPDAVALRW